MLAYQRSIIEAINSSDSRDGDGKTAVLVLANDRGVTDDIHLFNEKLREWEDYYNYHRPHGALDGQTPYERLVAKTRAGVSPAS